MSEILQNIDIVRLIAIVLALTIAVVGHEIMHGWVAYRYGDNLAKSMGRLSPNPLVHIDPIGTIAVPLALFFMHAPFIIGWAKPVPVDYNTVVRNGGHKAMLAVDLAGIAYNLMLGIFLSILLPLASTVGGEAGSFLYQFLYYGVTINITLAIFNLWPVPPLDGGHALKEISLMNGYTPLANFLDKIEPYGLLVIILIINTPLDDILLIKPLVSILHALQVI